VGCPRELPVVGASSLGAKVSQSVDDIETRPIVFPRNATTLVWPYETLELGGTALRRVRVEQVKPGMVLAADIADGKGGVLLRAGIALNDTYVRALVERGLTWVYISDESADSARLEDLVLNHLHTSCRALLAELDRVVERARTISAQAGKPVRSEQLRLSSEQEADKILSVMGEVLDERAMGGLAELASSDQSLVLHGLDTAIVALIFGSRIGLAERHLRSLALGCLFHDCGKLRLGDHLLVLPILSEDQMIELRQHPDLGTRMVRELGIEDAVVAAIVSQHHERQDGLGYPRGLRGTNRVGGQQVSGRISLPAEVAAIADTYVILRERGPGDGGFQPEQLVRRLRWMSGSMLNRQLVDCFLQGLREIPLGARVYVRSGPYVGWTGVVVRRSDAVSGRPVVWLTANGDEPEASRTELDLGQEPDVEVSMVMS